MPVFETVILRSKCVTEGVLLNCHAASLKFKQEEGDQVFGGANFPLPSTTQPSTLLLHGTCSLRDSCVSDFQAWGLTSLGDRWIGE